MIITLVIGNLGKDPEIRYTKNDGKAVVNLSIASNDFYAGEKQTTWERVVVWGLDAENCAKYLKKGSKVAILGNKREREYEDKEGELRKTTEVHAFKVEFLSSAKSEDGGGPGDFKSRDEIPF